MSDESEEACLVNQRSPSLSGKATNVMPYTDGIQGGCTTQQNILNTGRGSQQSHESETGELIDYNDEILLSQFHSDAIKQASCGKFQLIAALITGLGLAGHAIQVYAVFYIMPSAEVEFCILDNEKNWLGNITLLGLGVGALIWGGLADRTGRRKTLLSCLGVSGVFSVIAAFMPTYGPFMMARFCAAAGIGGALPSASSYLCELTPVNGRARVLSILGACGVAGGILAGGIAILTVPLTGQMVMLENKEHFSAWHRYLLLITLPTIGSILGLFWLPESPRYLLENSREVEALAIYQKIYRNNRTRGGYALTELELPGPRGHRNTPPASVLAGMAHSINMYCGSYVQIGKNKYLQTTILLFISWTAALFIFHGFTIYISEHSRNTEGIAYETERITKFNVTYEHYHFNTSMDNVIYDKCIFHNCTFRKMFLSHVSFNNCTFEISEFANVKSSRTLFKDSILDDIRFIDTDLTERHFINCNTNNTKIISLLGSCDRDFEYNIFFDALWKSNLAALIPALLAVCIVGECIQRFGRNRISVFCFSVSMLLCIVFGMVCKEKYLLWIGGTAQGIILAGLVALTILSIETYTTPLRCTALGVFVCGGHLGALISVPVFMALPVTSTKFAACISALTLSIPTISSFILKDPCLLL